MVAEKFGENVDKNTGQFKDLFEELESNDDAKKLSSMISELSTRILDRAGKFKDWERKPDGTMFPRCLVWKEHQYFHSVNLVDKNCCIYCREDWVIVIDTWEKCTEIRWNPEKGISSGSDYKMTIYEAEAGRTPQTSEDYESRELSNVSPEKVLKVIAYCCGILDDADRKQQESQDQAKLRKLTGEL